MISNDHGPSLLQVERAGIPPLAVDPKQVQAILDADKPK
jgi:hypothetical protein